MRRNILDPKTQQTVTSLLQKNLLDLINLALQGKQAHWNVQGRNFRSVHLELDEIIDSARAASDEVAERIATLGVPADGQARTIGEGSALEPFPGDFVKAEETVSHIADRLEVTIKRLRESIGTIGESDTVSQDLLIGIAGGMEKHLWMIQSQEG